ncbi:hypothetical protein KIW84_UN0875 [Lathyrus oleraceus]|nr:hypothetical protein KIW84_UN0875 [Pisum sativum]
MMPFQDLTNANFASRFYQRAHDNEAGPSTTYASRVPSTGGGDEDTIKRGRDINVINCDGKLTKVQETMGYYDPLQYPILLPFGTYGWDIETKTTVGKNVTCREYYSYVLQGLQDALHDGENNADNVGQRTILPSSFIGSKRDMTQGYQDGMAIVLNNVHMLLILDIDDKLREPEEYDSVVKAEIPRHESEPELYEAVVKHMIHGSCGVLNQSSPCPDRVAMEVHRGTCMDEIQQYVDARWICAPEALWKIFKFTLYKLYPSVERLQIHLPNNHQVRFYKHQRITNVLNDNQNAVTMLTEFFALNQMDPHARNYLYREIPEHYCWLKGVKNGSEDGQNKKYWSNLYSISFRRHNAGKRAFLPRIKLKTTNGAGLPFAY